MLTLFAIKGYFFEAMRDQVIHRVLSTQPWTQVKCDIKIFLSGPLYTDRQQASAPASVAKFARHHSIEFNTARWRIFEHMIKDAGIQVKSYSEAHQSMQSIISPRNPKRQMHGNNHYNPSPTLDSPTPTRQIL